LTFSRPGWFFFVLPPPLLGTSLIIFLVAWTLILVLNYWAHCHCFFFSSDTNCLFFSHVRPLSLVGTIQQFITSPHYKVQEVNVVCMMFCRVLVRTLHSITDSDYCLALPCGTSAQGSHLCLACWAASALYVSADHLVWFHGEGLDLEANLPHPYHISDLWKQIDCVLEALNWRPLVT
jgi:hypothetical protein